MANLYSGKDGKLYFDGSSGASAKVKNWSFTASQAILETVSLGDTDRTIIPGIKSVTGSCSIYYYQTSPGSGSPAGGASQFFSKFVKVGSNAGGDPVTADVNAVRLRLAIDDTSTDMRYLEVVAYITSFTMTCSVGEVVSADISFEANGAPTALKI